MEQKAELLPCPFCGGAVTAQSFFPGGRLFVGCTCDAGPETHMCSTEEDAASAWNAIAAVQAGRE